VEHKQKRDDLTGRQPRLRPAWRRPAGAQQRRLPLRHKRLAKIIDLAKTLDDPIQHHRLHHSAMAAYLKKLFRHNPLVARKPLIRVILRSIEFDHRAVFVWGSLWRLSKKLSKEHQARGYTQAGKGAPMAVIPDDPGTLRARLERT